MTDSNSSLNEVPALLDERRRYEGWLAALEARRESTPRHVFDRVQADYRDAPASASPSSSRRTGSAIESERASVQSRLSLLAAEEQLRRDERAELELRTHVGELVGEEADRAFGSVDEVICRLVGEKDGLAGRRRRAAGPARRGGGAGRACSGPAACRRSHRPRSRRASPSAVRRASSPRADVPLQQRSSERRVGSRSALRPHFVEPPRRSASRSPVVAEAPKPACPKRRRSKPRRTNVRRPRVRGNRSTSWRS